MTLSFQCHTSAFLGVQNKQRQRGRRHGQVPPALGPRPPQPQPQVPGHRLLRHSHRGRVPVGRERTGRPRRPHLRPRDHPQVRRAAAAHTTQAPGGL